MRRQTTQEELVALAETTVECEGSDEYLNTLMAQPKVGLIDSCLTKEPSAIDRVWAILLRLVEQE